MRRTFEEWRGKARALLAAGISPDLAAWDGWAGNEPSLLDVHDRPTDAVGALPTSLVPPPVIDLLSTVACHRHPHRYALMYRLLWRVTHGEHDLLQDAADHDVARLEQMAKAVRLASHKMTAFVRFREVRSGGAVEYVAVFEPEQDVLARTAPFFVSRFGTMVWTIVTPDGGAHWDRKTLTLFDTANAPAAPPADATEGLWLTYYASIFNPARLNVAMMSKEMAPIYWKGLPEATLIPSLVANASVRAGQMVASTLDRERPPMRTAKRPVADVPSEVVAGELPAKAALNACRRCPLGAKATQAVPGQGPAHARVMLVGEQPGDEEDLAGKPFIGPAGKLLRRAMEEAGLAADHVYITNAVKHFSYEPRGKRRIHKTPAQREIEACEVWLEAEIASVKPKVIVALGASALAGVMHTRMKVGEARAASLEHAGGARVLASYHPSAVLRAPDEERKRELYAALVEDLRKALTAAPPVATAGWQASP